MSQELEVYQVAEGVWWSMPDMTTDRSVIGAIAGADATLMVDAGSSPAHVGPFLDELRKQGAPPVRYVIYTHAHWDHVWGGSEIKARHQPVFIAHELTRDKLLAQSRLSWDDASLPERVRLGEVDAFSVEHIKAEHPSRTHMVIVPPSVTFQKQLEIDLGGVHCLVEHVGGDHAPDSTLVYARERKVVFTGDTTYAAYAPVSGLRHFTRQVIFQLLDHVLAFDAEMFVLSHTPSPLPREQMMALRESLWRVATLTLDEGLPEQEVIDQLLQADLPLPLTPEFVSELVGAFRLGAGSH